MVKKYPTPKGKNGEGIISCDHCNKIINDNETMVDVWHGPYKGEINVYHIPCYASLLLQGKVKEHEGLFQQ